MTSHEDMFKGRQVRPDLLHSLGRLVESETAPYFMSRRKVRHARVRDVRSVFP